MKRLLTLICILGFVGFFILHSPMPTQADELEDIQKKLEELQKALSLSIEATTPLEKNLTKLQQQLNDIKNRINQTEKDIQKKEREVKEGEELLITQQEILNKKVRNYYKNSAQYEAYVFQLFLGKSLDDSLREFGYQKKVVDNDKDSIVKIVMYITDLEEKKRSLEQEKEKLAVIKEQTDVQAKTLDGEVKKAKAFQSDISGQIAELSARQKDLLAKRLASLNIPRSAGTSARGCSDDRDIDPGFSPRLAFFTYGAPHRNGLNQYGAWGRAKQGQNEERILQEYYPSLSLKKDYDQNIQISTTTGWSGSIEDYVKRIYEVPDSWTDNNSAVLKAQAVAARTYALKVTNNGASQICTSEQCQVFKPEPKGGNWEQAVEATKGWVLMDGGSPGFTQYASTHGGYIQNLGKFDGDGGNPGNFSELNQRAFDKESPWFYCDWGARSEHKNTAWLKPEEVADIVNVILLAEKDISTGEHLYQTDKPHPFGGEIWREDRVRQELSARGVTPFTTVSNISVNADFGSGKTTTLSISGNTNKDLSAAEFKDWFNLRAPANLQIVGPLYNVEKR